MCSAWSAGFDILVSQDTRHDPGERVSPPSKMGGEDSLPGVMAKWEVVKDANGSAVVLGKGAFGEQAIFASRH